MRILREVGGYPVEDDADARLMEHVDHLPEIIRCAEARGRCKIAGDLIAPRAVERVLSERHELDMRIGKLLHIRNHLLGELDIGERIAVGIGAPRGEVHLVDIHRRFVDIGLALFLIPLCVAPFVA